MEGTTTIRKKITKDYINQPLSSMKYKYIVTNVVNKIPSIEKD